MWVLVEGVDESISKTATLVDEFSGGTYFPFTTFRLPDCPYSYQKGQLSLTVCPYIAIYSYQKGALPLTVCPYIAIHATDTFFYLAASSWGRATRAMRRVPVCSPWVSRMAVVCLLEVCRAVSRRRIRVPLWVIPVTPRVVRVTREVLPRVVPRVILRVNLREILLRLVFLVFQVLSRVILRVVFLVLPRVVPLRLVTLRVVPLPVLAQPLPPPRLPCLLPMPLTLVKRRPRPAVFFRQHRLPRRLPRWIPFPAGACTF
jgi:hypothetical protein